MTIESRDGLNAGRSLHGCKDRFTRCYLHLTTDLLAIQRAPRS